MYETECVSVHVRSYLCFSIINCMQVSREFDMIVEQEGCQEKFCESWEKKWTPAIMKIAKAERVAEEAEAMDEGDSNICKYQHRYCV